MYKLHFRNKEVKSYSQEPDIDDLFVNIIGEPTMIDGKMKVITKRIKAEHIFKINGEKALTESEFFDLNRKSKFNVSIKVKEYKSKMYDVNTIEIENAFEISSDANFLTLKSLDNKDKLLKTDLISIKDVIEITEVADW